MTITYTVNASNFVPMLVPDRFYLLMLQKLADAINAEAGSSTPPVPAPATALLPPSAYPASLASGVWPPDKLRELRPMIANNKTATALMVLTSANPGQLVTFEQVYTRAERTFGEGRADLAVFTMLIEGRFGHNKWPVEIVQKGGRLAYFALPQIADAWNDKE